MPATQLSTSSGLATLHTSAMAAVPPRSAISASAGCRLSSDRAAITTFAPSAANATAMPLPTPCRPR